MNQQEFQQIFDRLPRRQRQVLLELLRGETDAEIAEALEIEEATVRKYIERISKTFGLTHEESGERRSKRSEIVALLAQHKPELLQGHLASSTDSADSSLTNLIAVLSKNQRAVSALLQTLIASATQEQKKEAARTLNKLGHEIYMEGVFQHATYILELAVNLCPELTSAHYNLGSTYEKLYKKDLAQRHYQEAAKGSDRAAYAAMNNLARLQILQERFEEACSLLEPRLEEVKDPDVKWAFYKNLGWAYWMRGKLFEAKMYLKSAIDLGIQRPDAHCLMAKVQERELTPLLAKVQDAKLSGQDTELAALLAQVQDTGFERELMNSWKNCAECSFQDRNAAKAAWRFPELDLWQAEARSRLNTSVQA